MLSHPQVISDEKVGNEGGSGGGDKGSYLINNHFAPEISL